MEIEMVERNYLESLPEKGLKKIRITIPIEDERMFKYLAEVRRLMHKGDI